MIPRRSQATWLELVVSHKPHDQERIHEVELVQVGGAHGSCVGITIGGRTLCSSAGDRTVFNGLAAARRFLTLSGIDNYKLGGEAEVPARCCGNIDCLRLSGAGLTHCELWRKAEPLRQSFASVLGSQEGAIAQQQDKAA